mgnify:CR=1 FL=1
MQQLKKRSTTIHEDVRRMLGVSRDIYAFCAYVHYRCADSRQKRSGWCCDNKQDVADFVGVTRPGLYKMAERLHEIGLIEISNYGDYRATPKWVDAETNCKQSLQNAPSNSVNKVDKNCKQSLQNKGKNVNKVYTDTLYRELDIKLERERNTPAPESQNLKEEKIESGLVAPGQNPETVEAEIPPSKKVAPKKVSPFRECANCNGTGFDQNNSWGRCDECEGSGQANPSTQFQVTAIASPTEFPNVTLVEAAKTRAENTLEAEQMIATWITSEGEQTVKHRYNTAKQRFDPENAAAIAAHYCSVYTKTAANKGRLLSDPITHFSDGLFSYLKNEETFGRNNAPGNQAQTRNGRQGQKANINNLGSNPERYAEKPLF